MAKSIIQKDLGRCYLCDLLGIQQSGNRTDLEEHHVIFGTAGRAFSEKYGLKVMLDVGHHRLSTEAVHLNAENALLLKKIAQYAFIKKYGAELWAKEWGKNYLDEKDMPRKEK